MTTDAIPAINSFWRERPAFAKGREPFLVRIVDQQLIGKEVSYRRVMGNKAHAKHGPVWMKTVVFLERFEPFTEP